MVCLQASFWDSRDEVRFLADHAGLSFLAGNRCSMVRRDAASRYNRADVRFWDRIWLGEWSRGEKCVFQAVVVPDVVDREEHCGNENFDQKD